MRILSFLKECFRRLSRLGNSIKILILILVGIFIWMASGAFSDGEKTSEDSIINSTKSLAEVFVETFPVEKTSSTLKLLGRTEARNKLIIKSRIRGEVERIFVEVGSIVEDQDPMMNFKERGHLEAVKSAEAKVRKAEIAYSGRVRLRDKGLGSEIDIASSQADLENARYGLAEKKFDLENLVVKAPFSGFVEKVFVEEGEFINPGMRLAQLVHLDRFLVVTSISEDEIQTLRDAEHISAKIRNFQETPLTLKSISTLPNPVTNTFRVEMFFDFSEDLGDKRSLKEGLSAEVLVKGKREDSVMLPLSIFVLNDDGVLGVRGVNGTSDNREVVFFPVEILREENGYVWVRGVPKGASVIISGFKNVAEGSKVKVMPSPVAHGTGS